MKRPILLALQLTVTAMILLFLTNCDKHHCVHTYTLYQPVYSTLSKVKEGMKSSPAKGLKSTGKMYIYGDYIFLNEPNEGIHIIDNSKPASPRNIAFITIPGNLDLAVLGNTLYADSYRDLVAFDITNPLNVTPTQFVNNVFPQRSAYYMYYSGVTNPDSIQVCTGWINHDTTLPCDGTGYLPVPGFYLTASLDQTSSTTPTGMGGSTARFTILNNYLYAVTYSDLNIFNLSKPQYPAFANKASIGWDIETIYPFQNKLFIGSTSGVFIYDVSTPGSPERQTQFQHVRSCDPVIANDDHYAWSTLRTASNCGGSTNELDVIDISKITSTSLLKSYNMTNPQGLSKDGNVLFVCDAKDGLKIYDATYPDNIKLIKQINGLEPSDVIAWNNRALVVAKDGLYQFDYSDLNNIRLLSKIGLN